MVVRLAMVADKRFSPYPLSLSCMVVIYQMQTPPVGVYPPSEKENCIHQSADIAARLDVKVEIILVIVKILAGVYLVDRLLRLLKELGRMSL